MPEYTLEVHGEATEYYSCEAESEEAARELFESGKIDRAYYTEVSSAEVVRVTEEGA